LFGVVVVVIAAAFIVVPASFMLYLAVTQRAAQSHLNLVFTSILSF
jgi:hypothetical protein